MKAAFYTGNKTLEVRDIPRPAPGENEVSVKIAFSGICGTDLHIFHGVMDARTGLQHIPGHECSGTVDAVGDGVTKVKVGDKVVVMPLRSCGVCPACKNGLTHICHKLDFIGVDSEGSMQEYWNVPENILFILPDDIDLELAAMIEPLAVACHDVNRSRLKPGETAVILGGGPIGILIALVAKQLGARVLLSEINEYRLKFAERLGIETVNPQAQDIVAFVNQWSGTGGADVSFEVTGSKQGAKTMTQIMTTRGRIVAVGIFGQAPEVDLKQFFLRELELYGARVYESQDYEKAINLVCENTMPLKEMISTIAPLDKIQEVFESLEGNTEVMKVLISC